MSLGNQKLIIAGNIIFKVGVGVYVIIDQVHFMAFNQHMSVSGPDTAGADNPHRLAP